MKLDELTVFELVALANILVRISEEIPPTDGRAIKEAREEIVYVLRLIGEKERGLGSRRQRLH
jgi:hypothetical protein